MAFLGSVVSITSSGSVAVATHSGNGPYEVQIQVTSGIAYLGSAAVTTSGFPLSTADTRFAVVLMPGETLYGAVSTAAGLKTLAHYSW